jgi:hypothetical protein
LATGSDSARDLDSVMDWGMEMVKDWARVMGLLMGIPMD